MCSKHKSVTVDPRLLERRTVFGQVTGKTTRIPQVPRGSCETDRHVIPRPGEDLLVQ